MGTWRRGSDDRRETSSGNERQDPRPSAFKRTRGPTPPRARARFFFVVVGSARSSGRAIRSDGGPFGGCARGSDLHPFCGVRSLRSHRSASQRLRVFLFTPSSDVASVVRGLRRAARPVDASFGETHPRRPARRLGTREIVRRQRADVFRVRDRALRMTSAIQLRARGVPAPRPRGRPPDRRDDVSRASRSAPEPIPGPRHRRIPT